MKQMCRKLLCFALALSMALGCGISALGANEITSGQIEATENSWKQAFTGYTGGRDGTVAVAPEGLDILGFTQGVSEVAGVNGLFGKFDTDTAFQMTTGYNKPASEVNVQNDTWPALQYSPGADPKPTFGQVLEKDDVFYFGFEFATDSLLGERSFQMDTNDGSGTRKVLKSTFSIANRTGKVTSHGVTLLDSMPLNEWVQFDFVLYAADATVDVYVNGVQKVDGAKLESTMADIGKISNIRVWLRPALVDGTYAMANNWIDNFYVGVSKTAPTITPVELTQAGGGVSIDNATKTITTTDAQTPESLKEGLGGANVSEVFVVDGTGAEQSGTLQNGYVRAVDADGRAAYYTLNVITLQNYLDEDFDDSTFTDADTMREETGFGLGHTLSPAPAVSLQSGVSGRDADDKSAAIVIENYTGSGGELNLTYEHPENITDETVSIELSILMKSSDVSTSVQVPMNNTASQMRTMASFEKDGSIRVDGADTGLKWKENNWYKVAATFYLPTAKWDVYINGQQVVNKGALGSLSQVDFLKRFKVYQTMPAEAGSYNTTFLIDDCKMYNSAYAPADDQLSVAAADDAYIVSERDKMIYIPAATTTADFLSNLTLSNAELAGVYTSDTLETPVAGDSVGAGNTVVFRTQSNVFDAYSVALQGEVLGIEDAEYVYDNAAHTIYAPVKTPVSVFYNNITLYSGHTGQLVIDGTPLEDTDLIERGKGIKYRVSFGKNYIDYDLITEYKFDNFDGFVGQKMTNNTNFDGYTVYGGDGAYIEGIKEGSNSMLHAYTPAAGDGISIRRLNMTKQDIGDRFVITWDMKVDSLGGLNALVLRFQDASGNQWQYNNLINFTETGVIQFNMQSAGSYEINKWYRMTIGLDCTTKQGVLYINGEKVMETSLTMLNSFDHIIDLILSAGSSATSERNTWMDNFALYQIYDINAIDVAEMQSSVTSSKDIIGEDGMISGYGASTVDELLALLTLPEGASAAVYDSEGGIVSGQTAVAEGMELVTTAADGRNQSIYPIGEALRSQLDIAINGRVVNQLYAGTASATAEVYTVTGQPMVLVLEEYKDGALVQSKESEPQTVTDAGTLSVTLETDVEEVPGVVLKAYLYDNLEDKNLLIPVREITYSDKLELSTEILKVKDGKDAIYTITMDDGYGQSTDRYFRPWFEKYNLVGTGLNICTTMLSDELYAQNALEMTENGILDIISHSYTHPTTEAGLDANLEQEIIGSQEFLRDFFPGQDVLSYGPGNGVMTEAGSALLSQYYYASRAGTRGWNSLDMTEEEYYDIKVQGVVGRSGDTWWDNSLPYDGETAESMNTWVDHAIDTNTWLVEMWHSICWDDGTGSGDYVNDHGIHAYRPIPHDIAEKHLQYVSQLQEEGKIWVAKFDDVIRYMRERQNATLVDNATKTSRVITLTHDLDPALFNYALTLKSEVPADWRYAKIEQNLGTQTAEVFEEDGKYYIMYNVYPNEGDIVITKADAMEESAIKNLTIYTPEKTQDVIETMEEPFVFEVGINKDNKGEDMPNAMEGVDESDIHWYVNGELQPETGTTFTLMPEEKGSYRVYAQAGFVKSQFRTVTIIGEEDVPLPPMQDYMVNDSFDGTVGSSIPYGEWDYVDNRATMGIRIAADPVDENNTVAQYWDDNTSTYYPFMNAPIDASQPFVISGKAYLNMAQDMYHCIVAHDRGGLGYVQGDNIETGRKGIRPLLCFSPGGVISTGGTWIGPGETVLEGSWEPNTWIRYDMYVTPNEADLENSSVKIVVSGVKDAEGNPATLTVENNAFDLSGTTYATNKKVDIGFVTALVNGPQDTAYVDDIQIYVPAELKLRIMKKTDLALDASVEVLMSHAIDSTTGIDADDVIVTAAGGEQAEVSSVDFDPINPDHFTIHFASGALKADTEYNVALADTVTDLAGQKMSVGASFTTSGGSVTPPDPDVPSYEVQFSATGAGTISYSGPDGEADLSTGATRTLAQGSDVTVTANAAPGGEFLYWVRVDTG
ncbi:MAG TPA: Ig-like domain-containing protein, partial [Candidatus Aphodoplasma excrementigallinarum]|nr:Ig-like domain-containing protein [Candidatus Aphodoplasma excrementigallinarum]